MFKKGHKPPPREAGPVKTPTQKAAENPQSMRMAINAMCYQCIYDPKSGSGTWREQVKACTSPNCALFNLRPVPKRETKGQED